MHLYLSEDVQTIMHEKKNNIGSDNFEYTNTIFEIFLNIENDINKSPFALILYFIDFSNPKPMNV